MQQVRTIAARRRSLGFLACALASGLWGCGFFFGKIALEEMGVGAMVFYRFAFATLCLLPLIDLALFMASTMSVSSFYLVSQKELFPKTWHRTFLYVPFLLLFVLGYLYTGLAQHLPGPLGAPRLHRHRDA